MSEMSNEQLNEWLAENLFDWKWMARIDDDCAWLFPPDSYDFDTGEKGIFGEPIFERRTKTRHLGIVGQFKEYAGERKQGACHTLPKFSTDLASAFVVVERMRERKLVVVIDASKSGYNVSVHHRKAPIVLSLLTTEFAATLEELPKAICECVKKVLG